MRSRKTNFLQAVVLVTGIIYILTGGLYALSPKHFGHLFSIEVLDDWFMEIPKEPFMFMVLTLSRAASILICTMGLAMLLPLFDPLKYRALIYYTGIIFPLAASLLFIINCPVNPFGVILAYSIMFPLILVLTAIGLAITRDTVVSGVE